MGQAKRMMMEEYDRGYSSVGKKWVCPDCFNDEGISEFVKQNGKQNKCSYCQHHFEGNCCAPIDDVIAFIVECIEQHYDIPENELPYDGKEGGFQGETTDTRDILLHEHDIFEEDNALFHDVHDAINSQRDCWCERDYFGMKQNDIHRASWDRFRNIVTYQCRFVFSRMTLPAPAPHEYWDNFIDPLGVLDKIGDFINSYGLVSRVHVGTTLFRVRIDETQSFSKLADLGPPKCQDAILANRMSPAGIAMCYAAGDKLTALKETWDGKRPGKCSLGEFQTLQECSIVDFTRLPMIPSIFEKGKGGAREELRFLRAFVKDLVKSIDKDGRQHSEYIPTQVVAEFIRHVHLGPNGENIQGIAFPSSKNVGKAYAFFWGHPDDGYQNPETLDKWCSLAGSETIALPNEAKKWITVAQIRLRQRPNFDLP